MIDKGIFVVNSHTKESYLVDKFVVSILIKNLNSEARNRFLKRPDYISITGNDFSYWSQRLETILNLMKAGF